MTKRNRRVTLKDVAQHAGVSVKTASNVKNNWPHVSDETRDRVKRAMAELGYRPSHVARSLKTGRSQTIGVIVPDITNPFFGAAFRACEDALSEHGYSTFLCNTEERRETELYYLDVLSNHGVDGVLLWGSQASAADLAAHCDDTLPVVSVDGQSQDCPPNFVSINIDNASGAELATAHLLRQGRRQIVHLSGARHRGPAQARLGGFRAALAAAGVACADDCVLAGEPTLGSGYALTERLLATRQPDALFCYNDLMAIGAMAAIHEAGLRVPEDIAVVGFDDINLASLVRPWLTTVRIAQYALGAFAAEQLLAALRHANAPTRHSFPVRLVVRESCGARTMNLSERRAMMQRLVSRRRGQPVSAA